MSTHDSTTSALSWVFFWARVQHHTYHAASKRNDSEILAFVFRTRLRFQKLFETSWAIAALIWRFMHRPERLPEHSPYSFAATHHLISFMLIQRTSDVHEKYMRSQLSQFKKQYVLHLLIYLNKKNPYSPP